MTDTKALQLAARFALPPNSLGYCGKGTAPEKFKSCIIEDKCTGVAGELDKFIVLGPYLRTLAKITGKNKTSYPVVEAYWLGNNELKKSGDKDYATLLHAFEKQGVPAWFLKELESKKPIQFIPFHLFQILHVGVGRASGAVPYNLDSINNCMVRWGKVEKITKTKLDVNLNSLKKVGKSFKLTFKKGSFSYRLEFFKNLNKGDTVAVHWKQVVRKLTEGEVKNLEYWTNEVISTVQG
jgi:hypothetical protein